jgi:hypothetical protein
MTTPTSGNSTFEIQQRDIQAEIAQRERQIAALQKAQQKIGETVVEIKSSNETTARVLEQLREKNPMPLTPDTPTLQAQELATMLQFVIDVKKADSLHGVCQQTSSLNQEASQVEEEAIKLAAKVKVLKELTAQIRQQLTEKQQNK